MFFALGSLHAVGGFFGFVMEASGNTRTSQSGSGGVVFGLDLNDQLSLGVKTVSSYDFNTVAAQEIGAILRYYLLQNRLFAQGEAGCVLFFEYSEMFPAFYGGLTAGWRFTINRGVYLEPLARLGYPFLWGFGLTAGISWKGKEVR